jgi:hypothetical protein
LREGLRCGSDRQELAHGRERRRGADGAQEGAPRGVLREERAHGGPFDDPLQLPLEIGRRLGRCAPDGALVLLGRGVPAA